MDQGRSLCSQHQHPFVALDKMGNYSLLAPRQLLGGFAWSSRGLPESTDYPTVFQVPEGRARRPQTSTDILRQSEVSAGVHIFIQQILVEYPLGTRCRELPSHLHSLVSCSDAPFITEETETLGVEGTQPGSDGVGI